MRHLKRMWRGIGNKGLQYWVWPYIMDIIFNTNHVDKNRPIHLFFAVVDHFEPFNEGVGFKRASDRMKTWRSGYRSMAEKFKDADGRMPQHTWFYPPHLDHCFLEDLVSLSGNGYGDVEMHLHHNHMEPFPDTPETLRKKIERCIEDYSKYGIFCLPDGSRRFAFIHGDWSLDNSVGDTICGVNNEITILKECGCYADFTFPSLGAAQPSMINKMYYVKDDPTRPKSYNRGKELIVGGNQWGDLLMVQGIIGFRWRSRTKPYKPSIEASNLDFTDEAPAKRIDYLVKNSISIKGNPNWRFIKLHTHGAREDTWDVLLKNKAEKMYEYLEKNYNDEKKYILHYVTAREMYNLIKASEAGYDKEPNKYRDYIIKPYQYKL